MTDPFRTTNLTQLRFEQRHLDKNRPPKQVILDAMARQATLADADFLRDYLSTGCVLRKPWMRLMVDHHLRMLHSVLFLEGDIDIWWGIRDREVASATARLTEKTR